MECKNNDFDTFCAVDIQLAVFAGVAETIAYLETQNADEAKEALKYILKCNTAGDFENLASFYDKRKLPLVYLIWQQKHMQLRNLDFIFNFHPHSAAGNAQIDMQECCSYSSLDFKIDYDDFFAPPAIQKNKIKTLIVYTQGSND